MEKVGDTADGLAQIKSLLAGWQNLKRWGNSIQSLSDLDESEVEVRETDASDLTQNLSDKIDNFSRTIPLELEDAYAYFNQGLCYSNLEEYSKFDEYFYRLSYSYENPNYERDRYFELLKEYNQPVDNFSQISIDPEDVFTNSDDLA